MGRINILDKHIAELIAAGEVVERPSSVIKELVENSIDAGSTAITVEIRNGGVTYMRITDNGSGIDHDDIRKAFMRNATSKIQSAGDLDKISTLGFRGEALASICAVSKIDLMTKVKTQDLGTHYKIEGGEEVLFEDYGCPEGTTVIVNDLFYNTPARMKFLKKNSTEANAIAKIMDRIALSHPEISFKFIKDGKQELYTPGNGKIGSAIYSVYGREFFSSLVELDYKLNGVKVSGFVSKPTAARATRSMQHFFINGRYIKSRTAMVALEEAFKGSIMVQKFPTCVMYIEIPYDTVDVNVHPSKVEVRFIDEKPIFEAVYHGVKTALLKGDKPVLSHKGSNEIEDISVSSEPIKSKINVKDTANVGVKEKDSSDNTDKTLNKEFSRSSKIEVINKLFTEDENPQVYIPKRSENIYKEKNLEANEPTRVFNSKKELTSADQDNITSNILHKASEFKSEDVSSACGPEHNIQMEISQENEPMFEIKGEVFNTYIIVEQNNNEIIFIDKHAAHERLIYEELKNKKSIPVSQIFLEPVVVSLSRDEYEAIINNIGLLTDSGFDIDDFGNTTVVVRAAPTYLDNADIVDIVTQMAEHISENKKDISSTYAEWLYENIACRAAIKAGKRAKPAEMESLVRQIIRKGPKYCPHGRPIAITMKKYDIEKKFGRV